MNKLDIKNLLPKRPKDSHKGTFGHVLNIAGSGFYSGAAYFSSIVPLKVGTGKSTLASIDAVVRSVASLSPDIILLPLPETKNKTISPKAVKKLKSKLNDFQAISIGCGLSTDKQTAEFFKLFLKSMANSQIPLVIDADGLNILAEEELKLPSNVIFTPHPLEMSRLMGINVENILEQQEYWAQKCAEKFNCTVVLKTHETIVADTKGNLYINKTGNSALAKGGSGDVLTGMITGFLAQGLKPLEACILAVYLHGKAGELASEDLTEYSVLASDLLNYIPCAIKALL